MSVAIGIVIRLLGLFGVSLSPFWGGAIVAGLIAAALAGWSGYLVHAGYDWASGKCQAAQLREDNARLEARIAEQQRQLVFVNGLQMRDADRAQKAEDQLRQNQEAVDATPPNPAKCFTRDMSRRVRGVR